MTKLKKSEILKTGFVVNLSYTENKRVSIGHHNFFVGANSGNLEADYGNGKRDSEFEKFKILLNKFNQ